MKISVIGIEQNELISGKNLAEMGNEVIYVCKDYEHVNNIKKGYYTHSEKKILEQIKKKNSIDFTADLKEALDRANMCFISESEKYDVFNILANAKEVGANMSNHTFVVDRSELPINRAKQIKETIQEELNKRGAYNLTFEVISDPKFLRS
jgi:UDPglucose 6-dehydrogenase